MIDLARQAPGADPHGPLRRVHANPIHHQQINDKAAGRRCQVLARYAAAAHCDQQLLSNT